MEGDSKDCDSCRNQLIVLKSITKLSLSGALNGIPKSLFAYPSALHFMKMPIFIIMLLIILNVSLASDIFLNIPESKNVSLNEIAMFNCSTLIVGVMLFWKMDGSGVAINSVVEGEVKTSILTVPASDDRNQSQIICYGFVNNTDHVSPPALLLIQGIPAAVGNLNYSYIDSCSLKLSWTRPYTLEGILVEYNVIATSVDGKEVTNTVLVDTEYLWFPSLLHTSYNVSVVAITNAGPSKPSVLFMEFKLASFIIKSIIRVSDVWMVEYSTDIESNCSTSSLVDIIVVACSLPGSNVSGSKCFTASLVNGTVHFGGNGTHTLIANLTLDEDCVYDSHFEFAYSNGQMHYSEDKHIRSFDIQDVSTDTTPISNLCIDIMFVQGCKINSSRIELSCTDESVQDLIEIAVLNKTTLEARSCINGLPSNVYTLTVYEGDTDKAAFIVTNITIFGLNPTTVVELSQTFITTTSPTVKPESSNEPTHYFPLIITLSIVFLLAIVTITSISMCCIFGHYYCKPKNAYESTTEALRHTPHLSLQQLTRNKEASSNIYHIVNPVMSGDGNEMDTSHDDHPLDMNTIGEINGTPHSPEHMTMGTVYAELTFSHDAPPSIPEPDQREYVQIKPKIALNSCTSI